jgi:hypothetical protein
VRFAVPFFGRHFDATATRAHVARRVMRYLFAAIFNREVTICGRSARRFQMSSDSREGVFR